MSGRYQTGWLVQTSFRSQCWEDSTGAMIFPPVLFLLLQEVRPSPITSVLKGQPNAWGKVTVDTNLCYLPLKLGGEGTRRFLEDCHPKEALGYFLKTKLFGVNEISREVQSPAGTRRLLRTAPHGLLSSQAECRRHLLRVRPGLCELHTEGIR